MHGHEVEYDVEQTEQLSQVGSTPIIVSAIVGAVALLLGLFAANAEDSGGIRHFLFAYLIAFCFFLSISLGGLFFTALQHLTRAGWSVVVRRLAELVAQGFLPLAILFIPILLSVTTGVSSLYPWDNPKILETNHKLAGKASYLNEGFFLIRVLAYFVGWYFLSYWFLKKSATQDRTGNPQITNTMERVAAPTMIFFGLSISAASIDFLMVLDPDWYSTIFGVYYFAGSFMAFFATMIIAVYVLQAKGLVKIPITVEHRQDLGKLLFAFNCFWAYIAFSQYMLIWYAALPEETQWYKTRQTEGWAFIAVLLIVGHFVLPFLGFMSRYVKRNPKALLFWAVYMLVLHWADLFFIAMPEYSPDTVTFGMIEILTFIGIGGLWLAGVIKLGWNHYLIPIRDPRLKESLNFHNS